MAVTGQICLVSDTARYSHRTADRTRCRANRQSGNPGLAKLMEMWREKVAEPYVGVTSDGKVRPDLYKLQDEGAPVKEATEAAELLLKHLNAKQRQDTLKNLDSDVWRRWANREHCIAIRKLRSDHRILQPNSTSMCGVPRPALTVH